METLRIRSAEQYARTDSDLRHAFETLYEEAFPHEERKELPRLLRLLGPRTTLRLTTEQGRLLGLSVVHRLTGFVCIEYLAVSPHERNRGIGATIVTEIIEESGDLPLLIEVEPPCGDSSRQRRIAFYERLGFSILPYRYEQPPLHPGQPPLPLLLMSARGHIAEEAARQTLYRHVYEVE